MASTGADYRYGYNGMEEEDRGDQVSAEIASTGEKPKPGEGNLLNTEYRLYDPRLAQWLTRDPVFQPWESPYSAMAGNPILFSDPQGLDDVSKYEKENNSFANLGRPLQEGDYYFDDKGDRWDFSNYIEDGRSLWYNITIPSDQQLTQVDRSSTSFFESIAISIGDWSRQPVYIEPHYAFKTNEYIPGHWTTNGERFKLNLFLGVAPAAVGVGTVAAAEGAIALAPAVTAKALPYLVSGSLLLSRPETKELIVDVGFGVFSGYDGPGVSNPFSVVGNAGKNVAGEVVSVITNPVPSRLARVIPANINSRTLGAPSATDVFVTAADDIVGLNAAQIAQRLTIPYSNSGFKVIEFDTPLMGISSLRCIKKDGHEFKKYYIREL